MTTDAEEITGLTDGRVARRLGNKRRMLLAGIKLIERTGNYRLSPADVTSECGLHNRSFHACFGDLNGYYETMISDYTTTLHDMIKRDLRTKGKSLLKLILLGK